LTRIPDRRGIHLYSRSHSDIRKDSSTADSDSFFAVNESGFPEGKDKAMLRFTILKDEHAIS
jgi:hypothetical protein